MKIIEVKTLEIPEIKVIRYNRFRDHRGFFAEHFRSSILFSSSEIDSLNSAKFLQANESFSKKGVIRGLHFQWNPYMGKLVKTISGHMVDMVLDIMRGSPNFGKIILYDMPQSNENDYGEWIWVPPGFAHGSFFLEESKIEYFCTGEYSPHCETGISPFTKEIDWSICDEKLKNKFYNICTDPIISGKDKNGPSLLEWVDNINSENFIYEKLKNKGLC